MEWHDDNAAETNALQTKVMQWTNEWQSIKVNRPTVPLFRHSFTNSQQVSKHVIGTNATATGYDALGAFFWGGIVIACLLCFAMFSLTIGAWSFVHIAVNYYVVQT